MKPLSIIFPLLGFAACIDRESTPSTQSGDPAISDPGSDQESAEARKQRKLVFATSERYQGATLGGLEGADAICNQHASDARLRGTFKAWLSTATVSAASRLSHANVPYRLVKGAVLAPNFAGLIDGAIGHAIDSDEHGVALVIPGGDPGNAVAWTDTLSNGESYPWHPGGTTTENPQLDCEGWTGYMLGVGLLGSTAATEGSWTAENSGIGCLERAVLYCFEQ
jgi:hypothetical protein